MCIYVDIQKNHQTTLLTLLSSSHEHRLSILMQVLSHPPFKFYAMASLLYLIMLTTEQQQKALAALLLKKQNSLCADCNGKSPCWASLDFGVFVCMNCSGAHRFLGPTTTRVRSTKLDTWNREWLENMRIGNTVLNEYWEHGLTGVNRTAKPNINTSLNDIIKFVQDKYVKKKYVDPDQPLDPLKRSKLPAEPKSQIIQAKQSVQKNSKEPVKSALLPNIESPFNAFSNILPNKQKITKKTSDNLISFEKQGNNLIESPPDQSQPQQKYNHAQFHTISGSKPKEEDHFISFENLVKNNDPATKLPPHPHNPHVQPHNNYLLNPNANHYHTNAGHYSTGHFGNHPQHYNQSVQQYDRAQYVTMNINMNMYPKVMNINMNPQTNHYLPQQQPNHNFADHFLGQPQPQPQPQKQQQKEVKITLDSNISLQTFKKEKEEPKSWIDEWK